MERIQQLKTWTAKQLNIKEVALEPVSGDASFRKYYRITYNGKCYIIMDVPPPHENCQTFLETGERFNKAGVNVPQAYASDTVQGFLLLSDLGDELYLQCLNDHTADTLYQDAIRALNIFQHCGDCHNLPLYNEALLREEMALFQDWLLEAHLGLGSQTALLEPVLDMLVESALSQPQALTHRDYHSRNLMRMTGNTPKANNPGILDHQDAVQGPISYDLVSLLKDCYIKWSTPQINTWVASYLTLYNQRETIQAIRHDDFQRWFDLMGVQRHLKASGIFARLCHRDKKSGYLKNIPRTLSYIVELKADYPEIASLVELVQEKVIPTLQI